MKRRLYLLANLLLVLTVLVSACAPAVTAVPTAAPTAVSPTAGPTKVPDTAVAPTAVPPTAVPTKVPPTATVAPTEAAWKAPDGALVSTKAAAAPTLDGQADDAAWKNAPATIVKVSGGANSSATEVSLKSIYSGDMVYFVATWADPTESYIRAVWEKQADGTWAKLKDPNDKGGDNSLYYEDKLAFIWPINNSIPDFQVQGCFSVCHAGENADKKPYGNKYTAAAGQTGDIWHWKSVRNLGQIDDQFLDNTTYSADTPEAGRKSDKKDSGGYVDNQTEDKKLPAFMPASGGSKDGAPGYILDSEKVAFDDAQFKPGDRLPAIIKSAFVGDRGDIQAAWKWANGQWTLEFGRKLVTGSATDVQFDNLQNTYYFGLANFDNTQVRHAFQAGATPFVFNPAAAAVTEVPAKAADGALVSTKAAAAPTLDGQADDAAWKNAPATTLKVSGGANSSATEVSLKSIYSGDMVYFVATWADPTESYIRAVWEKQADGTWAKLKDPNDKGGDNSLYYEDKLAFIWPINNSIPDFQVQGCFSVCHAGENADKKPYGNKYTAAAGQTGDIWHWKSVRNLGQIDDQFLDNTTYSADTPEAGRKSDKKDSGGYVDNQTEDRKLPAFMPASGGSKDGAPGYILDSEKVAFDDAQFKPGDRLPAIIKSAFVGDRGDIQAAWKWANGQWTLEFGRKLVTGSATDVQFDNLQNTYYFGLANFDNTQVRHAFQAGATPFVFKP